MAETSFGKAAAVSVYFPSQRAVNDLRRKIKRVSLHQVRVRRRAIRKADWQDRWKKNRRPFCLAKSLMVVPRWHRSKCQPGRRKVVFLDTAVLQTTVCKGRG